MNYLLIDNITKSFGYEKIFKGLSFKVLEGEHIGLIGSNGSGKTTIFKIILGLEGIDSGRVIVRNGIRIGYLEQQIEKYNDMTVYDILKLPFAAMSEAIATMRLYEKQMEGTTGRELQRILDEYGRLQAFVETGDGYNIDSRIQSAANGLGIEIGRFNDRLSILSGGESTRVFLCKLLLEEPDLLLLDEPTNHLDIVAVGWLEKFLSSYKGTILTVSHDRTFLDNSVGKIVEIENGIANEYPGNYSWYKQEKEKRREAQEKQYNSQQKEIKRLEKSALQMRDWAARADNEFMFKRAVNIERRIEHMDKVEKPVVQLKSMDLRISEKAKSGKEIIRLEEVSKSYGDIPVLYDVSLLVRRGEKIVVSGINGSGKSTLVNIITGNIEADSGTIAVGEGVRTGYLQQDIAFEDEGRTLLEEIRRALSTDAAKAHKVLASYGFKGEHVMKKISNLSGGERKRLRLCAMMQEEYNLLIMDEPTNHMDISSREILEEALLGYGGTCLFISHDRFFINRVSSGRLLLRNGTLAPYSGDYTELLVPDVTEKTEKRPAVRIQPEGTLSKNRIAEIDRLEAGIQEAENRAMILEEMMMKQMSFEELEKLEQERQELQASLELLYSKWNALVK